MPSDARTAMSDRGEVTGGREARLRQVLDGNGAGVFRLSWDGTIVDCNDAFARILGLRSAASLVGQSILPFYPNPEVREALLARLTSAGAVSATELCLKRPADNTPVWLLSTAVRVMNEAGALEIEGTAIDVTAWKRATDGMLDSEARLRGVIRTAGSAIVCLDVTQRVRELNPAAERIFGTAREEAIGRPYAAFFPMPLRGKIDSDLRRIMEGASVGNFENVIERPDGRWAVVLWNIDLLRDAEGTPLGIVMVGQDITSRQRAEEALLRQTRYLHALTATDRAILGVQRPEEVASTVLEQLGELLPCRGAAVTALETGSGSPRVLAMSGTVEMSGALGTTPLREPRIDRHPGSGSRSLQFPLLAHDGPLGVLHIEQADDGSPILASDLEIAGQVADRLAVALRNWHLCEQAEDARRRLEALSTRLVDVQEADRRRLARELHDEIGQALTGLLLQLETGVAGGPEHAANLVRALIEDVRNLSLDLRPAILDDLGLLPALLWHVERFSRQTAVRVDFRHDGIDRRFGARFETAVYRIVQEALTNVARHAGAGEARVAISASKTLIRAMIEDAGFGFDADSLHGMASGLSGMRERATLLGGRLHIRSSVGGGTTIHLELPLVPTDRDRARPQEDR